LTNDIVSCLQCVECLSTLRVVMDGVVLLQNVMNSSKRFQRMEIDQRYQSLTQTMDLVLEFAFYRRYAPSNEAAQSANLGATEMLCLSAESQMTMAYLLDFWNHNRDTIGKIKCRHEGLKWLFTLCSHDMFVNELFTLFEDDIEYVQFRSLFQNPNPHQTEMMIRLNAVRSTLMMGTVSVLSEKTMSEAMDILLNSILLGISSSDVFKLQSLIGQWNDIKPRSAELAQPEVEEKKQADLVPNGQANDGSEVASWFRDTLRLPQYIDLFESEGFDELETLADLTDSDLKELGINKMGHRKKILKAVKMLNDQNQEQYGPGAAHHDDNIEEPLEGAPARVAGANVQDTLR